MDFYFLWLPEPKLPEKQKAYLGRFATQSRKEMEVKVFPRKAWKTPLPVPSLRPPATVLWGLHREAQERRGSHRLLTLLFHKESSPPHKFFILPPLSPSELPRLLPGRAGVQIRYGAQHHRDEQGLRLIQNGSGTSLWAKPRSQGEHSTALQGRWASF